MKEIDKIMLINNELGLKSKDFAELIGISAPNYSQMKKGGRPTGDAIINKLCIQLNIKKEWFENWDGNINDPVIDQIKTFIANKNQIVSNLVPIKQDVVYISLVNQYAYAGYLEGYTSETYLDQLPKIPFIVDYEGHGNYIAFEVRGDSMDDGSQESYLEGDRLYCREIYPYLWAQSKLHLRKWDFVIVHEDGILLKRITDHDVENHKITIHSLNPEYPDRTIDLADVKQIFNVIESVRPRKR